MSSSSGSQAISLSGRFVADEEDARCSSNAFVRGPAKPAVSDDEGDGIALPLGDRDAISPEDAPLGGVEGRDACTALPLPKDWVEQVALGDKSSPCPCVSDPIEECETPTTKCEAVRLRQAPAVSLGPSFSSSGMRLRTRRDSRAHRCELKGAEMAMPCTVAASSRQPSIVGEEAASTSVAWSSSSGWLSASAVGAVMGMVTAAPDALHRRDGLLYSMAQLSPRSAAWRHSMLRTRLSDGIRSAAEKLPPGNSPLAVIPSDPGRGPARQSEEAP